MALAKGADGDGAQPRPAQLGDPAGGVVHVAEAARGALDERVGGHAAVVDHAGVEAGAPAPQAEREGRQGASET